METVVDVAQLGMFRRQNSFLKVDKQSISYTDSDANDAMRWLTDISPLPQEGASDIDLFSAGMGLDSMDTPLHLVVEDLCQVLSSSATTRPRKASLSRSFNGLDSPSALCIRPSQSFNALDSLDIPNGQTVRRSRSCQQERPNPKPLVDLGDLSMLLLDESKLNVPQPPELSVSQFASSMNQDFAKITKTWDGPSGVTDITSRQTKDGSRSYSDSFPRIASMPPPSTSMSFPSKQRRSRSEADVMPDDALAMFSRSLPTMSAAGALIGGLPHLMPERRGRSNLTAIQSADHKQLQIPRQPSLQKLRRAGTMNVFGGGTCPTASSTSAINMLKSKRKNSGSAELKCPLCPATFARRDLIKRHVDAIHRDLRNFECHICGSKFKRSDNLRIHIQRHKKREAANAKAEVKAERDAAT